MKVWRVLVMAQFNKCLQSFEKYQQLLHGAKYFPVSNRSKVKLFVLLALAEQCWKCVFNVSLCFLFVTRARCGMWKFRSVFWSRNKLKFKNFWRHFLKYSRILIEQHSSLIISHYKTFLSCKHERHWVYKLTHQQTFMTRILLFKLIWDAWVFAIQ